MSPDRERSLRIWLPLPKSGRGPWAACHERASSRQQHVERHSRARLDGLLELHATYNSARENSAAPLIGQLA